MTELLPLLLQNIETYLFQRAQLQHKVIFQGPLMTKKTQATLNTSQKEMTHQQLWPLHLVHLIFLNNQD